MELVFEIPDDKPLTVTVPKRTDTRAARVWKMYLLMRLPNKVHRSGIAYCSTREIDPASFRQPIAELTKTGEIVHNSQIDFLQYQESDGDHIASCINLLWLLINEYSELFTPNERRSPQRSRMLFETLDRLTTLLRFHDSAEITFGDWPDDGSYDPVEKNRRELEYVIKNSQFIGDENMRLQLIRDFVNFQHPLAQHLYMSWSELDGHLIQVTRLVDKIDAVFSALEAELEHRPGDLRNKEPRLPLTERDKYFINLCDSSLIADTWAAHFIADYHDYYGFDSILEILYQAVINVRHQWYSWWPKICREHHIVTFFDPKQCN